MWYIHMKLTVQFWHTPPITDEELSKKHVLANPLH